MDPPSQVGDPEACIWARLGYTMLLGSDKLLKRNIPEAIKFTANGNPLWVPLLDKKLSFLANFQARNNPVANRKA